MSGCPTAQTGIWRAPRCFQYTHTVDHLLAGGPVSFELQFLAGLYSPSSVPTSHRGRSRPPGNRGRFLSRTEYPKAPFARRESNVAHASSAPSPGVVAGLTKSFQAP
jgi:hypothetical protein